MKRATPGLRRNVAAAGPGYAPTPPPRAEGGAERRPAAADRRPGQAPSIRIAPAGNWVAQLRNFAGLPARRERCELCAAALPERHAHLVEPGVQRLLCVCTPCALLFEGSASGRFRRVPTQAAFLGDLALSEDDWRGLGVPVDVAFFFERGTDGHPVALYPGAAGPVEAKVDAQAWSRLKEGCPTLAALMPDVEALLVNRLNGARECYRMPIDRCYALAGLIRRRWRGLSGGTEVWREVENHFARLRREPGVERPHA